MRGLERLLIALFPKTVHGIVSRQISTAYAQRWIDSKTMHRMAELSGFICRRPGYHSPLPKPSHSPR